MPRLRRRRRRALGGPALPAAEPLRVRRRREAQRRRRRLLTGLLVVVAVASAALGAVFGQESAGPGAVATSAATGQGGPTAPRPEPPPMPEPAIDPGTAPLPGADPDDGALPSVRPAARSPRSVRLAGGLGAGMAFDLDSGEVLWQRDPWRTLPIASLTKVMTALLVVDRAQARDVVRIPRAAPRVRGSKMGFLRSGRRVRVETLLHGLLMASGNDAAVALAVHVAGSERAFVARMNERSRQLGLSCTRYVSVHGLGRGDRSCPADLARQAVLAMAEPRIATIVRKRSTQVRIGAQGLRWLGTTNPLLQRRRPGVLGLKTGWTPTAGRCLIAVQRVGGRRRAAVLLRSADPGRAAERVFAAVR
jgi:D-alanyl-D-alanine carboxypeptidase (penicillin-binding protein 5/6)